MLAFPVIGKWTTWKIRDGRKVRIGEDPLIGAGDDYRLTADIKEKLRLQQIIVLVDGQVQPVQSRGRNSWKSSQDLALNGALMD